MLEVTGMLYWIDYDAQNKFKYAYKDLSLSGFVSNVCSECGRNIIVPQYIEETPHLVLEGGRLFPDLLQFCGAGDRLFIVSERTLDLFEKGKVSGYSNSGQCKIEYVSRSKDPDAVPIYYRLKIYGKVDLNLAAMHLKKKRKCNVCSQFEWNRTRIYPRIIDMDTWDGSDICLLDSIPGLKLCSEKIVHIVETNHLTGFSLFNT